MQNSMLLLACYELGHQPLSLAWPQAVLREAGIPVAVADLSVVALPKETAVAAPFVGIAVPMHTALRPWCAGCSANSADKSRNAHLLLWYVCLAESVLFA